MSEGGRGARLPASWLHGGCGFVAGALLMALAWVLA